MYQNRIIPFGIGLLVTLYCGIVMAQERVVVSGRVVGEEDNLPLADVIVQVASSGSFARTNQQGYYVLPPQQKGQLQLSFSLLGMLPTSYRLTLGGDTVFNVKMKVQSLSLKEVSVATKQKKIGSSVVIDRTAISHLQPTSLGDVLQLLPGQLARSPDMSSAQQINLRQVPSSSEAGRANALGTSIVLDGIPVSNNANMQYNVNILNSSPGVLPKFSSVAGRGIDLRQIPADQIESVEVVTGVPSVRHGDLTAGGVLVKRRAGAFRPQLTTRLNPLLFQQAVGMGFKLGKNGGILSMDHDYTNSIEDPRVTLSQYTRLGSQFAWSKGFAGDKIYSTTRLGWSNTLDNQKQDPDDLRYQSRTYSKDQSFNLGSNWQLNTGNSWFSSLTMDFGVTYGRQDSYVQELVTRDLFPVTDATEEGMHIARYGESEYLSKVTVSGRPLSIYNRLEGVLLSGKQLWKWQHKVLAGLEYRFDGNKGEGRMFDATRPPRQNYAVGDRPRSFAEVPALQQLAYYIEDQTTIDFGERTLDFHFGLRYDNIQPNGPFSGRFGNQLLPRMNLAMDIVKGLRIKGGYGMTAKSPTLSFMYPGKRYVDLVNYNYYAQNPAERLVVMTTKIFETDNTQLKSYVAKKGEFGLDYEIAGFRGYVTFYRDATNNAFGTNREVVVLPVARLAATSFPVGQPPVLAPEPAGYLPFYAGYDRSVNNRRIVNKGIEFQLVTPRLEKINTRFDLNGAWAQTIGYDNGESADYQKAIFSNVTPDRIAIYRSGFGNIGRRFSTKLSFETHFPELRFLLTGLVQTVWSVSNRNMDLSPYPIGYIDNNGQTVYLSPSQAMQPAYEPLRRNLSSTLSGTDQAPPLWLFNLRLSKEFKNNSRLAFYIDNIIADRGIYHNTLSNQLVARNQKLFFGAEFTLRL